MKKMNSKQKEILKIIKDSWQAFGYAPTIREIAISIGVKSPRAVSFHLEQMEKNGYIRRTPEGSRNIVIISKDPNNPTSDLIKVPLCGWTAGGEAIYAEENIIDWIPISARFFKTGNDEIFLLKVRGNSMAPKIEDGDVVVVRKQYRASYGETVVALLETDTTVKKYLPQQNQIILQPINEEFEPIVVPPDEVRIQGVVQGVLKYC
jgi:repressor LexA